MSTINASTAPLRAEWPGGRIPLADEAAEAMRTNSYWAWLTERADHIADAARPVVKMDEGHWALLQNGADADYEALHLRHSIGHSWGKYSTFGDIFSLRDGDNRPQATVLVADKVVVHAREAENARLSVANEAALQAFTEVMGFSIKADPLPFDMLKTPDDQADRLTNTRMRYLHRADDNTKTIGSVVLEGRLSDRQINALASGLKDGRVFLPNRVGLDPLASASGTPHELLSIKFVEDAPTVIAGRKRESLSAWRFSELWRNAAGDGWQDLAPLKREYDHRSKDDLLALRNDIQELSNQQKALATILVFRADLFRMPWSLKAALKVSALRFGQEGADIQFIHNLMARPKTLDKTWGMIIDHMANGKDTYDRTSAGGWCKKELDTFLKILEGVSWERPNRQEADAALEAAPETDEPNTTSPTP